MTSVRPTSSADLPRRRLGRTIAEMHVQLRTEGDTPVRKALSVGLGTLVGCTPLYGLHLPLCAGLAKLFGLNLIRTYLAAYVGNPLTLPFLLYAELGVGNLLFGDSWPALSFDELQLVNVWSLGRNILVGSVALGLVLGAVFAVIAYAIGSRWEAPPLRALLIEGASRRYVEAGIFHWEVVRGKLKGDPIYFALLESGLLPREGLLVDLGCGRGILLSLLAAARQLRREGKWSAPRSPPAELALAGVELRPRIAAVAAGALGADAEIRVADLDRLHAAAVPRGGAPRRPPLPGRRRPGRPPRPLRGGAGAGWRPDRARRRRRPRLAILCHPRRRAARRPGARPAGGGVSTTAGPTPGASCSAVSAWR